MNYNMYFVACLKLMGMKNGLYLPQFDFDSCGVGFVANLKGVKSHKLFLMLLPC
jgi:hypothetical protein